MTVGSDYWNHNTAYHPELLAAVDGPTCRVLDVGCGDGLLMQRLLSRAGHVTGLDPDAAALSLARARLAGDPRARLVPGGLLDAPELDVPAFDLVTCVAALHHMPLRPALERLRDLVVPGGRLRVIGLSADKTAGDAVVAAALLLPVRLLSAAHRESAYPGMSIARPRESLADIRREAASVLAGCRVRRRLYYRYSLTWTRPSPADPQPV